MYVFYQHIESFAYFQFYIDGSIQYVFFSFSPNNVDLRFIHVETMLNSHFYAIEVPNIINFLIDKPLDFLFLIFSFTNNAN